MEPVTSDDGAGVLLQPGQNIRPVMTITTAKHLVKKLYGYDVTYIKELNSYYDKIYFVEVSPNHSNPHQHEIRQDGYVFKVHNVQDSRQQRIEAEHEMQAFLRNKGVICQTPIQTRDGNLSSLEYVCYASEDTPHGKKQASSSIKPHLVRLMTYVPGRMLMEVPYTPSLLYGMGKYIGIMNKYLEGFRHEQLENHKLVWNIDCIAELTAYTSAVTNEDDKHVVHRVIKDFEEEVVPLYRFFQKGVIHGDCNEQNILVRPDRYNGNHIDHGIPNAADPDYHVHALLDFGHAQVTCYVFEMAINIIYTMLASEVVDPLDVGGYVLAGYLQERSLCEQEFDALKVCIAARYCQSLVIGAYTYQQDPGNEYVLTTAKRGWSQLHRLWNCPKKDLYKRWKHIIASYNEITKLYIQ